MVEENDGVEWLSDWYRRRAHEELRSWDEIQADSAPKKPVWLDPESEAQFDFLADIIAEEVDARFGIAPGEFASREGRRLVAELVADAILDSFQVRRRTLNMRRMEWREPGD